MTAVAFRTTSETTRRANTARRKFPPEIAHQIRLSNESSSALARRYRVSGNVIEKLRSGETYGPLRPDEQAAQERRTVKPRDPRDSPLEQLVIGPLFAHAGLADQDRQEALDAAYECRHGRLPTDRTPPCGCWPQEVTKTNPITTTQEEPHERHALIA